MENNSNEVEMSDKMRFLSDLLRKQTDLLKQIESRANVAIGFSGVMLTYAMTTLQGGKSLTALMSMVLALIAIVLGLFSLKPPSFISSRERREQSVFYHTAITKVDHETYSRQIEEAFASQENIIKQYALEVHNLVSHSLTIKKRFAHLSISMVVFGLLVSSVASLI